MLDEVQRTVRLLYTGRSRRAARFRYALILFDVLSIVFFITTAVLPATPKLLAINVVLGSVILLDLAARVWIAPNRLAVFGRVYVLADVVVLATIFLGPLVQANLGFLRVLRGLRLVHSYHLLRDLRRDTRFFRRYEDAIVAAVNLAVFVLFTTSFVYVLFFETHAGWPAYVDALYFTVATLTTTGYGDITPVTPWGKLTTVLVMLVGVALFVQLARAIFQPNRVRHKCDGCGLARHDRDAIHCKHCGAALDIETEGMD